VLALGLAAAAVLYIARLDDVLGLYVDDAWYVLLAEALATGQGFSMVNAPIPGVLPLYPPGVPLLLAPIVALTPHFPANVALLKLPGIVAMLFMAVVVYRLFRSDPRIGSRLGLGVALATLFHPGFVFLATSTGMPEPIFALSQLAAIAAVERVASGDRRGWVAGLLVAWTVLVRTIALPLLPVSCAYLWWRRQSVAPAARLLLGALLLLAPWWMYTARHGSTPEQIAIVNDQMTVGYATFFLMKRAAYFEYGWATWADLPGRVAGNLSDLAVKIVGEIEAYPIFRSVEPGVWHWTPLGGVVSAALTVLTVVGFVVYVRRGARLMELHLLATVGLLLFFPFDNGRYLLPFAPFFMAWTASGGGVLARLAVRASGVRPTPAAGESVALVLVALVCAVNGVASIAPLVTPRATGPLVERYGWRESFAENRALLDWVARNVPPDAVLATHNPPLVYLFTGRKTVGHWDPALDRARWHAAGARYWVDCWYSWKKFPDLSGSGLPQLYRSPVLRHGVFALEGG
jgi:hypothetical protein